MPGIRRAAALLALLTLLVLLAAPGCAPGSEAQTAVPDEVPLLALAEAPDLEIGVVEGDDAYQLQQVVDIRRLADGTIAVSDAQAARLSIFSPEGEILRSWGGRGDGPGEFRSLSGIRPWMGDSLLALDAADGRASLFDREGVYGREIAASALSADSLFSLDVWLHGRFVVDGVLESPERERVRRVLDPLRPPADGDGYRWVKAARDGRLWVREPGAAPPGHVRWTILDAAGRPEAAIDLPGAFEPEDPGRAEIVGRWLGVNDVNFVRAYAVRGTGETVPVPAWLAGGASDGDRPAIPAAPGPDAADLETLVRSTTKQTATAQELHYAQHFSYTTNVDSLELELEAPIGVRFLRADDRGWAGIFTHPDLDRLCGLGYGAATPPGWRPGVVLCGG